MTLDYEEYIKHKLVHSIHTSERRAFRSCRRRHNWTYKEMLYPIVTPAPLEFGVAFHKAMEYFYEPSLWETDPQVRKLVAIQVFAATCNQQLKRYKKLVREPDDNTIADYRDRVELGSNMIAYYCGSVSPQYDADLIPVEVEVAFEVPILSQKGELLLCKCDRCFKKWITSAQGIISSNECKKEHYYSEVGYREYCWEGLPVTYGGRLDLLAKDNSGRYWIVDWKTTSRILDEGSEQSFLELDDQISSYCWALRTFYNIPVSGFVYVEIKKSYPMPPKELKRPYRGRKLSTDHQHHTTYDMALVHILQNDPEAYEAGLYDEYLSWLSKDGPIFHTRHQIHKNDHEIMEIGKNLYLEAQDMVGNPSVYPQPGRFSCPSCLFRQPCLGMNQGEDYKYTLQTLFEKKELHYYEEQQSTTD